MKIQNLAITEQKNKLVYHQLLRVEQQRSLVSFFFIFPG